MYRGKKWTAEQFTELKNFIEAKTDVAAVAEHMGRTVGAITAKMEELGLSLLAVDRQAALRTDIAELAVKYDLSVEALVSSLRSMYPHSSGAAVLPEPDVSPVLGSGLPGSSVPQGLPASSVPQASSAPGLPASAFGTPLAPKPVVLPPLNAEQQAAFDLFLAGRSLCLTGAAGTGKSHIVKHIMQYAIARDLPYAITGLTGVAACLVGGQTIHKWTGLGLIDKSVERSVRTIVENEKVALRWRTTRILVIDEVSMLNQELFEKLNLIAQKVNGSTAFFGGIQVVFCGDFCQLAPIKGAFCFESSIWQAELSPSTVYLRSVQRQDNPEFIQLLSEIRVGKVTDGTKRLLNARIKAVTPDPEGKAVQPTMLYPHRKTGEGINTEQLALLAKQETVFPFMAKDSKYDFAKKRIVAPLKGDTEAMEDRVPARMDLCVRCQVMLTVNLDVDAGLVNGSRGIIRRFEGGVPVVLFDNGLEIPIGPHQFETDIMTGRLYRSQIPLVLAWATTIHKCQGSTLTQVITDLKNVFCEAQSYVTLSRVRSLDGLYLLGIDYTKIKCQPKVLDYYTRLEQGLAYTATSVIPVEEEQSFTDCVC